MNDTVTKILDLVSEYAEHYAEDRKWGTFTADTTKARQALQDELTRLFTPLRGQTFNTPDEAIAYLHGYAAAHDKYKIMGADPADVGLAIHMEEPLLQDIEQYRMQMAGISSAAFGYWKIGDDIHPDYDTTAIRDVANLYTKYDELYKAANKQPIADNPDDYVMQF